MEPVTRAVRTPTKWGSWARLGEEHLLYELYILTQKETGQTGSYGLYMSPGLDVNSTVSFEKRDLEGKHLQLQLQLSMRADLSLTWLVWSRAGRASCLCGGLVDALPWSHSDLWQGADLHPSAPAPV